MKNVNSLFLNLSESNIHISHALTQIYAILKQENIDDGVAQNLEDTISKIQNNIDENIKLIKENFNE